MHFTYSSCLLVLALLSESVIQTVLADQVDNWYFPNWNNYKQDSPAPNARWLSAWGVSKNGGWLWPTPGPNQSKNYDIVTDPTQPQSSEQVLRVTYPQGSRNPAHFPQGGIGFYAQPIQFSGTAKSIEFGYQVYFPKSYNFVHGGKLPGLFGGTGVCSGGTHSATCFSARFMWRDGGQGEIYAYLPQSKQSEQLCKAPNNYCNDQWGQSWKRHLEVQPWILDNYTRGSQTKHTWKN
ncbi:hypothetical protein BDF14DRAFT_1828839 [Spinellus fusiger]|nr:hypothetical protein BDF14DRAFT_1828839 [Spinellus fusiger]